MLMVFMLFMSFMVFMLMAGKADISKHDSNLQSKTDSYIYIERENQLVVTSRERGSMG